MVHTFSIKGTNIALDSASGAVHVLSDAAYEILVAAGEDKLPDTLPAVAHPEKFADGELAEAYSELCLLRDDGTLYSDDVVIPLPKELPLIKALCLHISHDCNLRCRYCFADTGDFCGDRSLMSADIGKRALEFLCERSGERHNLEVDFFGGEPMMNFDVVKELTLYGRELEKKYNKEIRFTMTTNGTLLDDDSIAFLNEHMSNIVLSIDGRKAVNDKNRPYLDGSGCYDDILPKYKKVVAGRGDKSWYARGTFTHENLDFCEDVLHLADCGFEQISVEPVVLDEKSPMALRESDLPRIFDEYEKLAEAIVERKREGRPFNFFHFMIDLDAGPCVYKRTKGCGSGCEYIAITPQGNIFPCHQFADTPEYRLGNIKDGVLDDEKRKRFAACTINTKDECKKCFARYFCGGGCAANNFKYNGAIEKPYEIACKLERKRLECALWVKAQLAD